MKVLNVNFSDEIGAQFNNFFLRERFFEFNCDMKFLVSKKTSDSDMSFTMYGDTLERRLHQIGSKANFLTGRQNRLQSWSNKIFLRKEFKEADLLHFHLIENGWFDIRTFFRAQSTRPSVWTWHDLWPTTGHCIQPDGCNQWLKNCEYCPDLDRPFAVRVDRTSKESIWKQEQFRNANFIIHVSTFWTRNQILKKLPELEHRIRVIPFGVEVPKNLESKSLLRAKNGFLDCDVIVLVRGITGHYKNMGSLVSIFQEASSPSSKIHLIDIESQGLFRGLEFASLTEFQFLNHSLLCELVKLSDLVILPSTAETFGVLGVEAQLLGTPVLYQMGTATEEVLGGDEFAYPYARNSGARAISDFLEIHSEKPHQHRELAERARSRAAILYSPETYLRRMTDLYHEAINSSEER
jgi:glycosyltransferase involved in cell wall biosynthesis